MFPGSECVLDPREAERSYSSYHLNFLDRLQPAHEFGDHVLVRAQEDGMYTFHRKWPTTMVAQQVK